MCSVLADGGKLNLTKDRTVLLALVWWVKAEIPITEILKF